MTMPRRLFIATISLPFLAGCFTVTQVPVPRTAPERESMDIKGVVVTDGATEQAIRFRALHEATWTPSSLSVVADIEEDGQTRTITRLFPITTVSGLFVRRVDAGRTSGIVGGLIVGTVAVLSMLITGRADQYE